MLAYPWFIVGAGTFASRVGAHALRGRPDRLSPRRPRPHANLGVTAGATGEVHVTFVQEADLFR